MAVEAALTQIGHRVPSARSCHRRIDGGVDWSQFDVAFIALHGRILVKIGQVQQILDAAGVPYTGSVTRRVHRDFAFSKSAAKERFLQRGVPTPAYSLIQLHRRPDRVHRKATGIGYPLVVKPDTQGSSLGISIVRDPSELSGALKLCFQFDGFGLLETLIEGTEWTVGLIDQQVLPAIKIETDREFFDWQAKYDDESTRYVFDSNAAVSVTDRIEQTGLNACLALGTSGLARVDLRLDEQLEPWVLEVNTVPGFTDHSLLPKAAAYSGIDFPTLCDRMVQSCRPGQPPAPHIRQTSRRRRPVE